MIGNVRGIGYKMATQVNFPGVVELLLILTVVKETHTSVCLLKVSKIWGASLVVQMAKNLPAMQETWVWSLGWEDTWRRKWLPMTVFLPGESHGEGSLEGHQYMGSKRLRTWLSNFQFSMPIIKLLKDWNNFYAKKLAGTFKILSL